MRGSSTPKALSRRNSLRLVVEVVNRQRRRVSKRRIELAVRSAAVLGRWRCGEIHVIVVDNRTMRRMNRRFLDHDYVTDVLSFPIERHRRNARVSGDIVVCADLAVRCATNRDWDWNDELLLYVVHGALHLIGYNDETSAQQRRMRSAEKKLIAELGLAVVPGGLPNRSGTKS